MAMDREYVDRTFLDSLTEQSEFFVTRLEDNKVFNVVGQFSARRDNILADDLIDHSRCGRCAEL